MLAEVAKEKKSDTATKPFCGVVRPIANIDAYPDGHWLEVHQILAEAADEAGYRARLVSDDEALGVILGRIVTNLHDDPIVVIDVSALNPNVLFELGMRLAFDKPVVVIKDSITRYPFDASPIEYLEYPHDLRHGPLMSFKAKLTDGIASTIAASKKPNYRSFLKHFGAYRPGDLGEGEALSASLIMGELASLRAQISRSQTKPFSPTADSSYFKSSRPIKRFIIGEGVIDEESIVELSRIKGIRAVDVETAPGQTNLTFRFDPRLTTHDRASAEIDKMLRSLQLSFGTDM